MYSIGFKLCSHVFFKEGSHMAKYGKAAQHEVEKEMSCHPALDSLSPRTCCGVRYINNKSDWVFLRY